MGHFIDLSYITTLGVTLSTWGVLDLANLDSFKVTGFIKELVITCEATGMNILDKNPPVRKGNSRDIEKSLCSLFKPDMKLILVILPSMDSAVYGEVKRVSDHVLGIVTQCVQSKRMSLGFILSYHIL